MKWALIIILNTMALFLIIKNYSTVKRYFDAYYKLMIWVLLVAAVIFGSCVVYEGRSGLKTFFTDYRHVFTGVGYLVVAVGLPLTVLQIRDAKKKAKSSFSYQLYKDGRELVKSVDKEVHEFIESDEIEKYSEEKCFTANAKIGELLQYYACAYEQWAYYDNLEEREWLYILDEFCGFLRNPQVRKFWNEIIKNSEAWDEGFRITGQQCLHRKKDC